MAATRQANWLGQQRVDVPHLRATESSIAADFDLLAGSIMAGGKAMVVRGFEMVTNGAIGNPATILQLSVAGGILLHPLASEHGTIFNVPADQPVEVLSSTNPKVIGSFTAGQTNYVGLDLRRVADPATTDLVMFLDANTLQETPKSVALARTLQYRIVISTTDFSSTPHILPLAKVVTNSSNTVTSLEDARAMAYRLGSGGSVPNRYNNFVWPSGRAETTGGAVFSGGDKAIGSLKDWMDAIMTRLWELGGGQYWYSATSDREVKLVFGQPVIPATGDNFQWTLGSNTIAWASLSVTFGNSPVAYNTITDGNTTLLDGQCLYVDIDRTAVAALAVQKGSLTTLGTPTTPGSRFIIAWRRGNDVFVKDKAFEVGRVIPVANTIIYGTVRLKYAAGNPADPTVLAQDANGSYSNIATGGNSAGFNGTGNGTGAGLAGTGGTTSGLGVSGTGGGPNGGGMKGTGVGTGVGVEGVASSPTERAFRASVGYADLPVIDTAGTIGIGTTAATTITLGRSGQVVTVASKLDAAAIDRTGTINIGNLNCTGLTVGRNGASTTLAGGNLTIFGNTFASIDSAGPITIGSTNATMVTLGRAGINVTVNNTLSVGSSVTTGGDVTIPSGNAFKYSGGQTRWLHVSAIDFSLPSSGSVTLTSFNGGLPYLDNGSASALTVSTQVRMPAGATILGLEILVVNASGASQSFPCHLSVYEYHATDGYNPITTVANASPTVASGTLFTHVWLPVSMTSTTTTVSANGFVRLGVTLPGGGTGAIKFEAARVQYRLDALAPNS